MRVLGLSANIMSLGGIAIAIGAMIDAAIVMVENLHKHIERDEREGRARTRWQQVSESSREVGPALFTSLLIITVSFIPVFALQAQEGRLFHPLAWTKTLSMAATMTAVNNIVGEVMPVVKLFMAHRMAKDSPRPVPRNAAPLAPAPVPPAPTAPPAAPSCGPMSLAELRHLDAIDAALTTGEARRHQLVTDDLPATDRRAWLDTLCSLDVPDAVGLIRRHIARAQRMMPGRPTVTADADLDIDTPSADGAPFTQEPPDDAITLPIEPATDADDPDADPTSLSAPLTFDPDASELTEPPDVPSGLQCAHCGEAPTACACEEPMALTPEMIAHAMAVQAALSPAESARVLVLAGEMPDDERDAWMAELSTFTVADAVHAVREALANLDGALVPDRMGPLRPPGDSDSAAPFLASAEPVSPPVDTATARSHPAPAPRTSASTSLALVAPATPESP
jgi:hypothetical protein